MELEDLGWGPAFAEAHAALGEEAEALRPARVTSVYGTRVDVWVPGTSSPCMAAVRRMAKRDEAMTGGIAVGDWALVAQTGGGGAEVVVERVLARRTVFLRKAAGERIEPQAIAANVDRVLVVTSMEGDFNVRRLERYLAAIERGGADATIVIAKADLPIDPAPGIAEASARAPTILTSARNGVGLDALRALASRGTTLAIVGSSGVGKSALVNVLLGRDAQTEGEVRDHDKRGRHTTTRRSLFVLPSGGLVIDTPGMRELEPWHDDLPKVAGARADIARAHGLRTARPSGRRSTRSRR